MVAAADAGPEVAGSVEPRVGSSTEPWLTQADLPGAAGVSDKNRVEFKTSEDAQSGLPIAPCGEA
jgi:hypothetical protein